MTTTTNRANVLGIGIGVDAIDMLQALARIESLITRGPKGYMCVTGVHGIMEAQKDAGFRQILNQAVLNVPDGMPTVWVGRPQGFSEMRRVFGPDLMLAVCAQAVGRGYRHFFYGGSPGVAEKLAAVLTSRCPGMRVVGTYTPPFRPLDAAESRQLRAAIARAQPDITWVGLSTPKQERFMAAYAAQLDTKLMVSVGAAFDLHTGRMRDAPVWVKRAGLQWLHRLFQDPRRLWKRYLINNSAFLWKISAQLIGLTNYELP
jgi:N-acetylglucosaminyldiphosphoundecaprenol N-acetyl-beta-D-mannosaminyltransferase